MKTVLFSLLFAAQTEVAAPLSRFPLEMNPEIKMSQELKTLKLRILTSDPKGLVPSIPKGIKFQIQKDSVLLTLNKTYEPISHTKPDKSYSEDSFLIDYKEPILTKLVEVKSVEQVEYFVNHYIENKNAPDMLPASVVAKRKSGDCKGHAILTSALLRKEKYPTRVVLGIVFNPMGNSFLAGGHAWTEVYLKGKWVIADAAQVSLKSRSFYLPLSELKDESASFQMGIGQNALPAFEKIKIESAL